MATKNLNVSIPIEMDEFLAKNPDLSPSKMLQAQIIQIKANRKLYSDKTLQLQKQCNVLQEKLLDANDEIEKLRLREKK